MEKATYSTKRKRRRTRKCLDEIRNRLQRKMCDNTSSEHSSHKTKACTTGSKFLKNSLVTMDRLTLKTMFPNAIKSDTVKRPVFKDIKNIGKELNDNNNALNYTNKNSCGKCLSGEANSKARYDQISSRSFILLSPSNSKKRTSVAVDENFTNTAASSSSQYNANQFYVNMINEIPSYFKQLPLQANDNIKTKVYTKLQKLYRESCHEMCKDNLITPRNKNWNTLKNVTPHTGVQSIVENPVEYIRLQHEPQLYSNTDAVATSESLSESESPSPPALCPDFTLISTPEYQYYPHRLK